MWMVDDGFLRDDADSDDPPYCAEALFGMGSIVMCSVFFSICCFFSTHSFHCILTEIRP